MAWGLGVYVYIKPLPESILLVTFCGIHMGEISQVTILYNAFEKCTSKKYCHISQGPMG